MSAPLTAPPIVALPTAAGTRYEREGGRLTRIVDADGTTHAHLTWAGDALVRLAIPGAVLDGAVVDDPLLGPAHVIAPAPGAAGRPTTISAIAWARPTRIPAIAAPALLPPGAAPALMNALAALALDAGVPALRYAGPYPTAALFRALARSFRTTATEAAFTADGLARSVRSADDELPFDFAPAPHERRAHARGHVELRDGVLERAVIDGVAYDRGDGIGRLATAPSPDPRSTGVTEEVRAALWFGDAHHADVAGFTPGGQLLDGPHPLPASTSPVLGQAFPDALRVALAELVAEAVPAPLAEDARAMVAGRPLRWADLGARAAVRDPAGFLVHAVLWDRLAPHGLARVALALAEALAPVVSAAIVTDAAAALDAR